MEEAKKKYVKNFEKSMRQNLFTNRFEKLGILQNKLSSRREKEKKKSFLKTNKNVTNYT